MEGGTAPATPTRTERGVQALPLAVGDADAGVEVEAVLTENGAALLALIVRTSRGHTREPTVALFLSSDVDDGVGGHATAPRRIEADDDRIRRTVAHDR